MVSTKIEILTVFVVLLATITSAKLMYTTEFLRHGARTPQIKREDSPFDFTPEALTSSGARQLFYLGMKLDKKYTDGGIYNMCSSFERTIKSAQSQMMGVKPGEPEKQLQTKFMRRSLEKYDQKQEDEFWAEFQKIVDNDNTGKYDCTATSFEESTVVGIGGCPGLFTMYKKRRAKMFNCWEQHFEEYRKDALEPLAKAFGIDNVEDKDFYDYYFLSDTLWSEMHHQQKSRYNFTDEQISKIKEIQVVTSLNFVTEEYNRIIFTRMIEPTIQMMRSKIGLSYHEEVVEEFNNVELVVYSTHDHYLSILMHFLNASNNPVNYLDYSSYFIIELESVNSPK